MRFSADIFFIDKAQLDIPTNFRRDIAALIKESIKSISAELYQQLWGDKKANSSKPFTFCVYFPNVQSVKGDKNNSLRISSDLPSLRVVLFISSYDPSILINFYNSLLNISGYKLFGSNIELKHFKLLREAPFNEGVCLFRTMSPIIVRNMDEKNDYNKKGSRYLTFNDAEFENNLYHSVKGLCKDFIDSGSYNLKRDDFKFFPIKCKVEKIHHYKEIIPATSGTFKIEAPAEVLKLIYDAGIGARRSQGFGMAEALRDRDV